MVVHSSAHGPHDTLEPVSPKRGEDSLHSPHEPLDSEQLSSPDRVPAVGPHELLDSELFSSSGWAPAAGPNRDMKSDIVKKALIIYQHA